MSKENKQLKENLPPQLGCIPDKYDENDFIYKEVMGAKPVDMPDFQTGYDTEAKYGELDDDDQGKSLGCVSLGITSDTEMSIKITTGQKVRLSPRYVYSQIFAPSGGSSPRDAYKLANKKGIPEDIFFSSPVGKNLTEEQLRSKDGLTPEVDKEAAKWKIGEYLSITSYDLNVISQAIFENGGVGGGYQRLGAGIGHFVFFKGYGMYKGYMGLSYQDSYRPYDKWLIKHQGKFYLDNPHGQEVQLFSVWTAKPGNWLKKKMKLLRKKGTEPVYIIASGKRYWITSWSAVDDFKELLGFKTLDEAKFSVEEVDVLLEPYGGIVGDLSFSQVIKHLFGGS